MLFFIAVAHIHKRDISNGPMRDRGHRSRSRRRREEKQLLKEKRYARNMLAQALVFDRDQMSSPLIGRLKRLGFASGKSSIVFHSVLLSSSTEEIQWNQMSGMHSESIPSSNTDKTWERVRSCHLASLECIEQMKWQESFNEVCQLEKLQSLVSSVIIPVHIRSNLLSTKAFHREKEKDWKVCLTCAQSRIFACLILISLEKSPSSSQLRVRPGRSLEGTALFQYLINRWSDWETGLSSVSLFSFISSTFQAKDRDLRPCSMIRKITEESPSDKRQSIRDKVKEDEEKKNDAHTHEISDSAKREGIKRKRMNERTSERGSSFFFFSIWQPVKIIPRRWRNSFSARTRKTSFGIIFSKGEEEFDSNYVHQRSFHLDFFLMATKKTFENVHFLVQIRWIIG